MVVLVGLLPQSTTAQRAETASPQPPVPSATATWPTQRVAFGLHTPVPLLSRYTALGTDEAFDDRSFVSAFGLGVQGDYRLSLIDSYLGLGASVSGAFVAAHVTEGGNGSFVIGRATPIVVLSPPGAREATSDLNVQLGVGVAAAKGIGYDPKGLDALVGLEKTWGLADRQGIRAGLRLRAGILGDTSKTNYLAPELSVSLVRGF